jgi:putative tryptophan/tyrosine transport system substrate-binding protein
MMRRRTFARGIGSIAFIAPVGAGAQSAGTVAFVGVLLANRLNPTFAGVSEKLRELGYREGRNLRLEIRSADAELERLPTLAAELVRLKPDVIVSIDTPPTREAINATKEIPIVMSAGDPIATGFVRSLSHPGGNVTGITSLGSELAGKRLQLLQEAVPGADRIAVLFNPDDPVTKPQVKQTVRAASQLGVEVRFFPVRDAGTLARSLEDAAQWRAAAVLWLVGQGATFMKATIDFANERRLPTMVVFREQVAAGGLISYMSSFADLGYRVAIFVDKVLRGAKVADLPVEQPTQFELVINLRTAKMLGLTLPASLLARADQLIE